MLVLCRCQLSAFQNIFGASHLFVSNWRQIVSSEELKECMDFCKMSQQLHMCWSCFIIIIHGDRSPNLVHFKKQSMALQYMLPNPTPLDIHDTCAMNKWKKFHRTWKSYSFATELNEKSEQKQIVTLLTVIKEEAHEIFSTFTGRERGGDEVKIVSTYL